MYENGNKPQFYEAYSCLSIIRDKKILIKEKQIEIEVVLRT